MPSDSGPQAPGSASGIRGWASRRVLGYSLLLGECIVILIPSIYGRIAPRLFGIPFFYWFQLLWIIVAMVVTGTAYVLIETRGRGPGPAPAGGQVGANKRGMR